MNLSQAISGNNYIDIDDWRLILRTTLVGKLDLTETFGKNRPERFDILDRVDIGSQIERLLLSFQSFDGSNIPAYLHQPIDLSKGKKYPGIMVILGHVRSNQSGMEQTTIEKDSYHQAAAMELAKSGYITLTFELREFGYLGEPFKLDQRIVAWHALLKGESYKQIILKDISYAKKITGKLARC